jgi:pimeloyl-ACP methyl ester carboxylesterase
VVADPRWQAAARRIVLGHSFGGMLALSWLLGRPETRIDGLVLIATTAGPMFRAVRLRIAWWRQHDLRVGIGAVFPFWDTPVVTRGLHWLLNRGRPAGAPVDFRALPYTDDVRVGLAGWQATDWRARRGFRHAMEGFDVRARLGELAVPTVVLHGDRDCYFPLAGARALALALPRAELRVAAGAGHVLPLTHGDAVLGALRDLLARAAA